MSTFSLAEETVIAPDGFLGAQVRRTSRNLLIANGAVLLLILVAMALLHDYFRGFFGGPFSYDDRSRARRLRKIRDGPCS